MKRLLAGVMCLCVASGCGPKEESPVPGGPASSQGAIQAAVVEVVPVEVPVRVEVTGQVTSIYQATLSSRVQGTIDTLLVREGVHVAKGDTLVELDSRDVRADLARATAEVDNARAQMDRMSALLKEDAVSRQEMENAARSYKVAEAARNAVLAQLSYTVVKAPFAGVITEKRVEAGELASPGQPLLKMEDPRRLRLEATVAEGDLQRVVRGDNIRVLIDALGSQVLTGVVSQILPAGDPQTHTFMVKVDLPPAPGLKTGMFGRFQLDKGTSRTILLPASAVVERGDLTSVFVVGPDQVARLRLVKAGRRFEQQREILSGVNAGERVMLDGTRGIDGASVRPVDAAGSPQ